MNVLTRTYLKEIDGIFSCTAFLVYNWALLALLWDMPSFLMRYTAGELVAFAAYQFMYALLESVVVTAAVAALAFLVPAGWVRNHLSVAGSLFAASFALSAIAMKLLMEIIQWTAFTFSIEISLAGGIVAGFWWFCALGLPVVSVVAAKSGRVQNAVGRFLENLFVLRGVYIATSALSMCVVVYRNAY